MKANSTDNTDPRWQKTPVANLVRHVQSGNYYARIRMRGKLIWKSLKTDRISVAKLRLGDFHKEDRQRAAAHKAVARGKMTFGAALETYQERLKGDYSLKDRSKTYREKRIAALLKSWPDLKETDVAQRAYFPAHPAAISSIRRRGSCVRLGGGKPATSNRPDA